LIITDWWILRKKCSIKNLINKASFFVITLIFDYVATTAQKDTGVDATSIISAAYSGFERFRIVLYSFLLA